MKLSFKEKENSSQSSIHEYEKLGQVVYGYFDPKLCYVYNNINIRLFPLIDAGGRLILDLI